MKMYLMKKTAAAVLALTLAGGAVNVPIKGCTFLKSSFTAHAEDDTCGSFDEDTGVLTLHGNVTSEKLWSNETTWYGKDVKKIVCAEGTKFPASCCSLINFRNVEEMDLSNADTSDVVNMDSMFYSAYNLKKLNLSGWDTSNVVNMEYMFGDCSSLEALDLGSFDTSNVRLMEYMFHNCKSLTSLNVSSFDTSNVVNMDNMFENCCELTSLDVDNFNTSNVREMWGMFKGCSKLKTIDLRGFDMSKTNLPNEWHTYEMFSDCTALEPDILVLETFASTFKDGLGLKLGVRSIGSNVAEIVMSGPNGDVVYNDFPDKEKIKDFILFYPVLPYQYEENITVRCYDKNGRQLIICKTGDWLACDCVLSSYCQLDESVLSNMQKFFSYYPSDLDFLNAVCFYCKASQNYFKGTDHEINYVWDIDMENIDSHKPGFGNDVQMSLVLGSNVDIRLYIDSDDVKIDGEAVTAKVKNGKKYYELKGTTPYDLTDKHTATIDGTDYEFSSISYVYRVLHNPNASKKLTEMAKAFYVYAYAPKHRSLSR